MGTGGFSRWARSAHDPTSRLHVPKRRSALRLGAVAIAMAVAVATVAVATTVALTVTAIPAAHASTDAPFIAAIRKRSPLAVTSNVLGVSSASNGLTVEAGWAGAFDPTAPIPVRVTITADRLVRGTLTVVADGFVPNSMPIEVAGGSRKRVLLVLPGSDYTSNITIAARIDGDNRLAAVAEIESRQFTELVAIMPGVRSGRPLPTTAKLAFDAGTARFSALQDDELALAPASIQALGTIALAPSDLRRMDAYAVDGLARWIGSGGHLLVAAEPGQTLPQLPEALQPGIRRLVQWGDGDVRMAGKLLGAGSWDGIVEPTPVGLRRSGRGGFGRGGSSTSLADELQADSGFVVPRLRWLVPGVAAYGVVLTVAVLLLRRRPRSVRSWLVLPATGLGVAVAVLFASPDIRSRVNPAQATILDVTALGTEATTYVGLTKGEPGRVSARFDPRWIMEALPSDAISSTLSSFATTPVKVTRDPGALTASVDLTVGTSGLMAARGPVESRGALEITARAEGDDRVAGTVRNTTPWRLESVAVMVATGSVLVGDLEPDEGQDWSLFVPDLNGRADRALGSDVWPVGNLSGVTSIVNFPAWWAWASTRADDLAAPGRVTVVGWTRGYVARVGVDDKAFARVPGRTAVVGRGVVTIDEAAPRRSAVRRTILRGDAASSAPGLARFDVAKAATQPALSARVVAGTRLDAWVDGKWTTIQTPPGSGPVSSGANSAQVGNGSDGASDNGVAGGGVVVSALIWNEVVLPAGAAVDGRVFLRIVGTLTDPSAPTPVELLTVGTPTPPPVTP